MDTMDTTFPLMWQTKKINNTQNHHKLDNPQMVGLWQAPDALSQLHPGTAAAAAG